MKEETRERRNLWKKKLVEEKSWGRRNSWKEKLVEESNKVMEEKTQTRKARKIQTLGNEGRKKIQEHPTRERDHEQQLKNAKKCIEKSQSKVKKKRRIALGRH